MVFPDHQMPLPKFEIISCVLKKHWTLPEFVVKKPSPVLKYILDQWDCAVTAGTTWTSRVQIARLETLVHFDPTLATYAEDLRRLSRCAGTLFLHLLDHCIKVKDRKGATWLLDRILGLTVSFESTKSDAMVHLERLIISHLEVMVGKKTHPVARRLTAHHVAFLHGLSNVIKAIDNNTFPATYNLDHWRLCLHPAREGRSQVEEMTDIQQPGKPCSCCVHHSLFRSWHWRKLFSEKRFLARHDDIERLTGDLFETINPSDPLNYFLREYLNIYFEEFFNLFCVFLKMSGSHTGVRIEGLHEELVLLSLFFAARRLRMEAEFRHREDIGVVEFAKVLYGLDFDGSRVSPGGEIESTWLELSHLLKSRGVDISSGMIKATNSEVLFEAEIRAFSRNWEFRLVNDTEGRERWIPDDLRTGLVPECTQREL